MRLKLSAMLAIFIFVVCPTYVFAQEPPEYKIKCFIDSNNNTLKAEQEVAFTNNSDKATDTLYFHIYPNREYSKEDIKNLKRYGGYFKVNPFPEGFQKTDFKINLISMNGKPLDFIIDSEDKSILKIGVPTINPREKISIKIDFQFTVPCQYGRLGQLEGITALHRWYPILCVYDKQGWHDYPFYIFHQPYFSEASIYDAQITVSNKEIVAHTGELTKEEANSDGTKTLFIKTPLPVRDFSLALSGRYKIMSEDFNGIKINSYYLTGDEFYAKEAISDVKDLMGFYTQKFGPYPYKIFNIAPVYLAYGGHETSNMIFIDTRVYKLPKFLIRYFDFLISHETGHQWLQGLVGSDEYREAWMDEGINSYFIGKYIENKYGKDALVMDLPKWITWLVPNFSFDRARILRYIYAFKEREDHPILSELASFVEPSNIFALTYGKGSFVLQMLKYLVGEEDFDKLMKKYTQDFAYKNADFAEFQSLADEVSKKDLDWFFDEWLKTTKYCDYAAAGVKNNNVIIRRIGDITMPIEVKITLKDGTEINKALDGKEEKEEIPVSDAKAIKSVVVDPDRNILDVDRVNNFWPRQVEVRPVPFYYFVYDIDVFLPEDKYTLTYGPYVDDGWGLKFSLQKPHDFKIWAAGAYDFGDYVTRSRFGFEKENVFGSQWDFGIEGYDQETTVVDDNVHGGKIYFRKDFFPPPYGFFGLENHATVYLLHDVALEESTTFADEEQAQLMNYLKKDQSIVGLAINFSDYYPYPDPQSGFKVISYIENSGHFMGAGQYFNRGSLDLSTYFNMFNKFTLAARGFIAGGFPKDKDLYHLGGDEGLRGYKDKSVQGSCAMLFSVETRVPLVKRLNFYVLDNFIGIDDIGAVAFFDAGKAWYEDFGAANFKKDVGFGIKLGIGFGGGMLEKGVLRFDVAQALGDEEGTRFWVRFKNPF